jgi:hypothetical protein
MLTSTSNRTEKINADAGQRNMDRKQKINERLKAMHEKNAGPFY